MNFWLVYLWVMLLLLLFFFKFDRKYDLIDVTRDKRINILFTLLTFVKCLFRTHNSRTILLLDGTELLNYL